MTQSTNASVQDPNTPNWRSKSQPLPGVTHAVADLSRRPKLVFTILATVIVLVALVSLISSKKEQKESTARNALYAAKKTLETEFKGLASAETKSRPMSAELQESLKSETKVSAPEKGAPAKTADAKAAEEKAKLKEREDRHVAEVMEAMAFEKMDVEGKLSGGVKELAQVHQNYTGTSAGFEAALTLGNLFFAHENYEKAATWFEKAAKSASQTADKTLATSALGYAQENQGKKEDATRSFESALGSAQGAVKAELMITLARMKAASGDSVRAKNLYEAVIKDYSGTEFSKKAEEKKAALK